MKRINHSTNLSEVFIPNSIADKKSNRQKAEEALIIAKSIPRPVRKAKSNECAFSRERDRILNAEPKQIEQREDGLINAKDAEEFYGVSQFTIQARRKSGLLTFKKEKQKYYYDPEEIKKIEVRKRKTEENPQN